MQANDIKGSILLAEEGINATVSGPQAAIDALMERLEALPGCGSIARKTSRTETHPFGKAKVRLKKEIVSSGIGASPATLPTGTYVSPKDWNVLISDPDTVVIDARNSYELHLGKFKGATDPKTRSFHELFDYTQKHLTPEQKIATYCTGGIRCEKYTAWLVQQGFKDVYHLEGGILNYLAEVPKDESLWEGACYVFDERVAVTHALKKDDTVTFCRSCGHPLLPQDRKHPSFKVNEQCGFCSPLAPPQGGS